MNKINIINIYYMCFSTSLFISSFFLSSYSPGYLFFEELKTAGVVNEMPLYLSVKKEMGVGGGEKGKGRGKGRGWLGKEKQD